MVWCSGEHTLKPSRRVGDREDECCAGAEEPGEEGDRVESTCWGIIEMSGKDLQGVVHLSVVVYLPIHCHRKVFGYH